MSNNIPARTRLLCARLLCARLLCARQMTVALAGCVALSSCTAPQRTTKTPEPRGAVRPEPLPTIDVPSPSSPSSTPSGSATPNSSSTPSEAAIPVFEPTPESEATPAFTETTSSLPLRLPAPAVRRVVDDPRILAIKEKLVKYPTYDGHHLVHNFQETATDELFVLDQSDVGFDAGRTTIHPKSDSACLVELCL